MNDNVVRFPIIWHKNCRCEVLPDLKSQLEIDAEQEQQEPPVGAVRILLAGMAVASALVGWWPLSIWFFICILMARKSAEYWNQ